MLTPSCQEIVQDRVFEHGESDGNKKNMCYIQEVWVFEYGQKILFLVPWPHFLTDFFRTNNFWKHFERAFKGRSKKAFIVFEENYNTVLSTFSQFDLYDLKEAASKG